MPKTITESEYEDSFPGPQALSSTSGDRRSAREVALEHALDIRKFEIQLYWTRSAYFWAFIGASLVAYGGTQGLKEPIRTDLAVLVCCVGLVFSVAWFLANKGSKHWQENWENHVDRLEDAVTGPLYKIVLRRPRATTLRQKVALTLTGPSPYSVSKINQLVSLYICAVWFALLWSSLPSISREAPFSMKYAVAVGAAVGVILCLLTLGRTHSGDMIHSGSRRGIAFEDPRAAPTEKDA